MSRNNILREIQGIDCWTCTLRYVRTNFLKVRNVKQVDLICHYLFNRLEKQNCCDFQIILKIMAVYNRWLNRRTQSRFDIRVKSELNELFLPLDENMSIISKYKSELHDSGMDTSLDNCNVKFTFALVRYGLFVGGAGSGETEVMLLCHFLLCAHDDMILEREIYDAVLQVYQCKRFLYCMGSHLYNRTSLLAKTLHAVTLRMRNSPHLSNYLECLELYFRAIPDPFIRMHEVREFCSFLFIYANVPPELSDSIAAVYHMLFPKDSVLRGPRSLKHLCRCSVRNILINKSGCLPKLVSSLEIPTRLHDYLLCAE